MVSVILAVLLLLPLSVEATTYYVSTTGSDSNDGSIDTPFRTIRKGALTMVGGDTVLVRGGTYVEQHTIQIRYSGTQQSPSRIAAYPGERPIIDFVDGINGTSGRSVLLQNSVHHSQIIAWAVVEGFEIKNGYYNIRWYNCQNCVIRNNTVHHGYATGLMLTGSLDSLVENNVIYLNDQASHGCCHGIYTEGTRIRIINNVIYGHYNYGIQLDGSRAFDSTRYASADFSNSHDAIISGNTIAYNSQRAGIVVWSSRCNNARIENNIFYENSQLVGSQPNGVAFSSTTCTGIQIRNNLSYASGSGGTAFIGSGATEGVNYTQSGNVVNGANNPGFVNGGSNALPASPDFSLAAASSPAIGMARVNEFPNNAALTVGAFKAVGTPTGSIIANTATLSFPMSTAVPIQIPDATGVTSACTSGGSCPGSPTVSSAGRRSGTDSQADVTISGITDNACQVGQTWTISYDASAGSWTGNDHRGPAPGLHQKIFSFTNLSLTNACTGSGPPAEVGAPIHSYAFSEGTGTTTANAGSAGGTATLENSAGWGEGKTGSGLSITSGTTQQLAIGYGSGVNPSSQNLTLAGWVYIPDGTESANHYVIGPDHGTNQRFYICGRSGLWKLSIQDQTCANAAASNLSVTSGWQHLCWRTDATADTSTLYKDGVVGTGGAVRPVTSFTLASNLTLGRVATLAASGGRYDDWAIYTSLEDCAAIYAASQTPPPTVAGTFAQAAVQAQAVYLPELGGTPTNLRAVNASKKVVANGGLAWVFQIHCTNVSDCDETAFRLEYRKNGTGSWLPVPNTPSDDQISMWGSSPDSFLNAGATSSRLTGSCAVTNGSTVLTASQIPSVNLPQDGCVMLRYLVRVGAAAGNYFELRVVTEGGQEFSGSYTYARMDVDTSQAGGF